MSDKVVRIGTGGKLYRDAREAETRKRVLTKLHAAGALPPETPEIDELDLDAAVKEALEEEENAPKTDPNMKPVTPPTPQQPDWGRAGVANVPSTEKQRDWRGIWSTILEIAGIAAITTGFWQLAAWLGPIVLGVCLILMGLALGVPPAGPVRTVQHNRRPTNARWSRIKDRFRRRRH